MNTKVPPYLYFAFILTDHTENDISRATKYDLRTTVAIHNALRVDESALRILFECTFMTKHNEAMGEVHC